MQELQTGEPDQDKEEEEKVEEEEETETEDEEEELRGGSEQQDLLVRRAGRLSFKPLMTLSADRKLQLVSRRKWRSFWVTLRGTLACTPTLSSTHLLPLTKQAVSPQVARCCSTRRPVAGRLAVSSSGRRRRRS